MKKIPERTCIGCGQTKPKNDLLRIVKDKENNVFVDLTGKKNGRGAYICANTDCLEKARKSKGLERSLKVAIPDEVYENLEKELENLEVE